MRSIQKTLAPVLAAALLAGCAAPAASSVSAVSSAAAAQTTETAAEPLRVVTTIFPLYDWVRQTAGEDAPIQLTLLLDGGTDLHSYQPSAQDMVAIADCDLFIYVGGESDAWVEDALAGADNPDRRTLNLLDLLGTRVYEEETVEGMEPEEEEDHDHEEHVVDEHIWTSLRNAQELSAAIGDVLGELDPAHADQYTANAIAYGAQLAALDGEYASLTASAPVKTLLFGDRFPFRYLVEDYALDYYAAFPGCSADTEASFETVAFLAEKTAQLDLPAVLTIEGSDGKIARTILQTAGGDRAQLTLDAMQGTTAADIEAGATYLSIMEQNLGVLRQALGVEEEN